MSVNTDSYQKIKNRVLIKATGVRTSYITDISPPRQVVFKDTNEELLSGYAMSAGGPVIKNFENNLPYVNGSFISININKLDKF